MLSPHNTVRLLIVDASFEDAEMVTNLLRKLGFAARASRVEEVEEFRGAVEEQSWDIIVCAAMLPQFSVAQVAQILLQSEKDIPLIIIVDEKIDSDDIDEMYAAGVRDVVFKSRPLRLQSVIRRELQDLENRRVRRHSEMVLEESERRVRALLESSRDAIGYVHEGMHIYANRAYLELFGCHELDEIEGMPLLDMIAPEEHGRFKVFLKEYGASEGENARFTLQARKADGHTFTAAWELTPASIEGEFCTQIVIRDETSDPAAEEKIKQVQQRDILTGLFSRPHYLELIEKRVLAARAGDRESGLLYIAIDQFNRVRARVGIGASDLVVVDVARILQQYCDEKVILARFGDDIFTLLLPHGSDEQEDALAEQLRQAVDQHLVEIGERSVNVTCSIGICRIGESAPGVQQILERAHKACLKAQEAGGNRIERYRPVIEDLTDQEKIKRWEAQLWEAMNKDGFSLLHQPIVSLHGETEEIYEVLLRMIDEAGNYVLPEIFLEPAAQLKLMGEIDRWVIAKAISVLHSRHQVGQLTRFFVKLSDPSIHDKKLLPWLKKHLQESGLDARSLIFEISERSALNYLKRVQQLAEGLRALGCQFALEHVGTGLDTSNCLKHIKVDYLKINGAFIENLLQDEQNQEAVKTIIEMAKEVGKPTIAEFVSDANTLALLWQFGVDYAQGHYIQEPNEFLSYEFSGGI
ncbi:GGDEF/EAL domain-containing response regulator [Nitrosococcus watsonii]|uniref:Response regulator receiver modulated diguanylate cyclase/phosphodiesterase with PAS/PAC sensor(S) n=1 Tax=Nitrosococcus watsoni (strain C-113) TaxID=105559 RepID=D8KAR6_NITWC|nr:EAL domain-containing protein [Nitrosococcus watsonii]ADJ29493.1 response regulator receiver modulated diguanylate cyclase/phosphodiesterase with PAS/PAC sensor(s) [Nitrosococcus watsonii C-113]